MVQAGVGMRAGGVGKEEEGVGLRSAPKLPPPYSRASPICKRLRSRRRGKALLSKCVGLGQRQSLFWLEGVLRQPCVWQEGVI